jgi:hypothetical protein
MQEKAARDVSRMLDRPNLRHMVELAEEVGHGDAAYGQLLEGHALARRETGRGRRPESRVAGHDAWAVDPRAPDSRNHDERSADGRG